jgi:hypothetical protein
MNPHAFTLSNLGTGKTLLPSILAKELGVRLVCVRISDVIQGAIGAGEQAIAEAFSEARRAAPSIIFIDEFQVCMHVGYPRFPDVCSAYISSVLDFLYTVPQSALLEVPINDAHVSCSLSGTIYFALSKRH